jgi:hypothetical protein
MLYLRNTNQIQTIDNRNRGLAPERPWSAISASYYEVLATGSLSIIDGSTTLGTLTTSGSLFNARISASNEASFVLSGSNAALTGSFTMSLQITSSDYSYSNTIYSKGIISTTFQIPSGSIYTITGSVEYNPNGGAFSTCSFAFVKTGLNPATASYTVCGATSSTSTYIASTFTSASLGCVNDTSVVLSPSGSGGQYQQLFLSPYDCNFSLPTGSNNRTITFSAPTDPFAQSPNESTWYLASWIGEGTGTYLFKVIKAGQSISVCTPYPDEAYFSPGSNQRYNKDYITIGGVC